MILPKCWLARIQKYWDAPKIPADLPESSSTFSVEFDSEETTEAVRAMEANIGTEASIVKPTDIPENEAISDYLGTFDVEGTPGELTLLSPEQVNSVDVDVAAYHYDEANDTWTRIEDAHIVDGYVWGTVSSFSPIAVFTTRLDTYTLPKLFNLNSPTYVANGVPIVVSVNDEGKTIVTDAYGKVTEITNKTIIVGGSLDHDLTSTSVTVLPGSVFSGIKAGSCYAGSQEVPLKVGKVKVYIEGVDNPTSFGVTGSYGAVRTDEVEIYIKDSKINFCGAGESICNKVDANKDDGIYTSMASKAWVKTSNITVDNSYVEIAYAGANCGLMYGDDVNLYVKNGSETFYTIAAGSNGTTNVGKVVATDSKLKIVQTTNRGIVHHSTEDVKNCEVEYFFPTGDSTDSTVTGIIEKAKISVDGGKINLYPGTNNGTKITRIDAANIIESMKITKATDVTFMDGADEIFDGMIKTK